MKAKKSLILMGIMAMVAPQFAMAVISFDQLDHDTFIVSHRVKIYGSRGRAMKLVYEKAASLCVAAGYTHLKVASQESQAGQEHSTANASVQVQFFFQDGKERIDCQTKATEEYIKQATVKLQKMGYQRPDPSESIPEEAPSATGTCTVEQIAALVEAGLSAEQIKGACNIEE